ncbi:MAG TPA: C-terminal helicase domain-containing protein, partial [Phycisphaerae bacterium]|nr:C-terminal helicase domain-containing protein [Phycisphaerae bacterium]
RIGILVATDVAARGLDIPTVRTVVNYDVARDIHSHIHRVGRTGRASAVGDAFTFVADDEQQNLRIIERAINKRLPRVTLPDFDYTRKAAERLEIPIEERIAAIRAQKAKARSRQQQSSGFGGQHPRPHGDHRGGQHGRGDNSRGQQPPRQGDPSNGASLGSMRSGGGKPQKHHRPGSGKFPSRQGGRYRGPAGPR